MKENRSFIKVPDELRQDCEKCQGLCCMALQHRVQDNFPIKIDKPVGIPCANLETESSVEDKKTYSCKIYGRLREDGWEVCPEYTCYGAGQAISTFFKELGVSWAEEKPEEYSEKEWEIIKKNQILAFHVLQEAFEFLSKIRTNYGDEKFKNAREVFEKAALSFSEELKQTDKEIDSDYWSDYFNTVIIIAIYQK